MSDIELHVVVALASLACVAAMLFVVAAVVISRVEGALRTMRRHLDARFDSNRIRIERLSEEKKQSAGR